MSAMTEAEAREKWCPHARLLITATIYDPLGSPIQTAVGSANRGDVPTGGLVDAPCYGSDCLAWRWWDGLSDDGTACHHTPTRMAPRVPETTEGRPLAERRGYCGLAGSVRP